MNCDKWEDVLIQWINCLKLTDPISDLESMRNGKFFIKLLGILDPTNIPTARNESLTHILEILKTQYLNYAFVKRDAIDLETLSVKDIIIIASLLMHYTCIVERKDSLIIPSCNKLPPDIQINIRNFLEKVNTKITEFHLNKIIEEMNESNISLCSYQWRPTGDSPLTGKSPLQDFLRTPNMKTSKYEKEREFKKLQTELEIERFEKGDLQEELKEYKQKIKKLENQVKDKSIEISKLQREFYSLEFSSPPHTNPSLTLDMEKQYKSRIQNLESFCDQLQDKQDQLQAEHMDVTDKLNASLEELKIWQQTSQSLELNNKDLLERSTRQAIELDYLNLQCAELTAILDEIRNDKDGNDSSLVFSPMRGKRRSFNERSFENLAHTIIDVQLKDAQKENTELKTFLKESSEKGNNLERELEDLKMSYSKLSKSSSDLENCKKDLMEEVEKLFKTNELLEENHLKVKGDLEEKLGIVNNEIEKMKIELLSVKDEKVNLELEIAIFISCNQGLVEGKQNQEIVIKELELQLKMNLEELNKFEDECNQKEIIISDTNSTLLKIRSDLQSKEHEFETLQQNLKELNAEASSYKTCIQNLETKNSEFENQVKILQDDLEILKNSKETLESKNLKLEQTVHDLMSELATKSREMNEVIQNLNQQTIDNEKQMKMLNGLLEEANKNIDNLEDEKSKVIDKSDREISEQKNEINRLRNQLYELNAKEVDYIQEIQSIKSELNSAYEKYCESFDHQLELKSEYEGQIKSLTENIHEMVTNYNQLEKNYQSTQSNLEMLSAEKEESKKEILTLGLTIKDQQKHHAEEINNINKQFAFNCNELELEKVNLQQSLANAEKDLAEIRELEKKLLLELTILFEKIEFEKDEKSNLINKIEHLESIKTQLEIDTESLKANHERYIKENEDSMKQREGEFEKHRKSLIEQSAELKIKLDEEIVDQKRAYDQEIEILNDQYNSNVSEFQIKESALMESLDILKSELEHEKQVELNSRTKINVMQKKIDDLELENEILINKIESLEQSLKQLEANLKQQKELEAKLESEVETLHNKINDIGIEKEKVLEKIGFLEKTKIQLEENCKSLKQDQEECILNNEKKLRQCESDMKTKLEVLNKDLMNVTEEKCQLNKDIQEQKSKFDDEIQKIHENYAIDISQFRIKENNLEQSLKVMESELEQQNVVKVKLSNDLQEMEQSLKQLEANLGQQKELEAKLESEVDTLHNTINDVGIEKEKLMEKIGFLEKTKIQFEENCNSLKQNQEEYILNNEKKLKQCENDMKTQLEVLNKDLMNVTEEKCQLNKDIQEQKSKFDEEIQKIHENYAININQFRIKENNLEQSLKIMESELEQQNVVKLKLSNDLEEMEQSLKQLETNLKQQKELEAKLESDVETLHNTINDVGIEKEKLIEKIGSLEKTKIQLEEKCNSLKQDQEEYILNNEQKLKQCENDMKTKLEVLNKDLMNVTEEKCQLNKEIQDQKSKFDEEIQKIHENYAIDISLEQSLKIMESELEQQNVIKLKLSNDLQEMSNKIENLEIQKIEFLKNIASLEDKGCEMKTEYETLKTCSEDNLKQQHEFEINIDHLKIENKDLQTKINELQYEIHSLELENKRHNDALEVNDRRYGEEIQRITSKMNSCETNNCELLKEIFAAENKLVTQDDEIENCKETIQEQIGSICQLNSDCKKLEHDLGIVNKSHKKLEDEVAKVCEKNGGLMTDIEEARIININKDKEILKINQELLVLQKINENMKMERELLDTELRKSKECHKLFINKISKEDIVIHDYNVLEVKYAEIAKEISYSAEEAKVLKKNLEESSKKLIDMYKIIENKDTILEEFRNKFKHTEEAQTHNEAVIKELTEELTEHVNNLIMVKNEKIKINVDLEKAHIEIDRLKRSRDDILDTQSKIIRETENNISRAHENAIDVKNELLMSIENAKEEASIERNEKIKSQNMLEEERSAVKYLELELLNSRNEGLKYENNYSILKGNISRLYKLLELKLDEPIEEDNLKQIIIQLEQKIDQTFKTNQDVTDSVIKVKNDYAELTTKIQTSENEKQQLNDYNKELSMKHDNLLEEKKLILQQQLEEKEKLQEEVTTWRNQYEELSKNHNTDNLKTENEVLHQTVMSLKDNNVKIYTTLKEFLEISRSFKNAIDKILKDRNSLETLINELKQSLIALQTKFVNRESSVKQQEQKEAFEIIADDIHKQFNRYSKMSYNIACNNAQISEKVIQGILAEKYIDYQPLLRDLNIEEVTDKLDELKGRTTDGLEQLKSFEEVLNKTEVKNTKVLKENVLKTSSSMDLKKDEEWRKKYSTLRQKVTLAENVKNNYEKKVRQLREENKKLSELKNVNNDLDNDPGYKLLLQQHIQAKDDFENKVSQLKMKYQNLQSEYVEYKKQKTHLEQQNLNANLESELSELKTNYQKLLAEHENLHKNQVHQENNETGKEIEVIKEAYVNVMSDKSKLELDNATLRKIIDHRNHDQNLKENQQLQEIIDRNGKEIQAIREAYVKVMSDKSKLEIDNTTLRKVIDDRNHDLIELSLIKEAYEKLLEENSKMMTQVDTLKYKRGRDKEEFLHLIKKERDDRDSKENRKIQHIRSEYEEKLESMKRKMLNLYKEEVDKETRRLTNNSEMLKLELEDSKRAIHQLRKSQKFDFLGSQDSLGSLSIKSECDAREMKHSRGAIARDSRTSKSITGPPLKSGIHDRRYATMPRSMAVIEETVRKPSIQSDLGPNLEMEDEDELFNNKYLMDLKDGHCMVNDFTEPRSSRVSELVWRNSMCPPHLKSSYPAEMQFSSPTHFKEDEIKTGNVDFDDSMSTKLLPGEKVRNKKDIGTTSYKKPGPPTPSKNGGRLSLQSNEIQPLKDIHDAESKTPKRTTPSRFKAFFLGFNSNSKNCIEPQTGTPKSKGTKIFRKPR